MVSRIVAWVAVIGLGCSAFALWKLTERLRGCETAIDACLALPREDCSTAERRPPKGSELLSPIPSAAPSLAPTPESTPEPEASAGDMSDFVAQTRLHAVSQMMSLAPGEREALQEAFQSAKRGERTADIIETVLGPEPAENFRAQVRDVFARSQQREEDREVFYYSRKLGLASAQEAKFRTALNDVERSIGEWSRSQGAALAPQEQLARMRAERDLRASLLQEKLQAALSKQQFEAYLAEQSASPAFELELFHEVPSDEEANPKDAPSS